MEQLNHIELRGIVGSAKVQRIANANVANFTLATNIAYRDKDGTPVIETTWHNVTAWEGKGIADLTRLEKGSKVHLVGRIRNQRFTGADGSERTSTEVVARSLAFLPSEETLQYQL